MRASTRKTDHINKIDGDDNDDDDYNNNNNNNKLFTYLRA
jgi:hypothetical protein